MKMIKLVYLIWASENMNRAETREIMLNDLSGRLINAGAEMLTIYIADPEAEMKSPAPNFYPGKLISAMICIFVNSADSRNSMEEIFSDRGFTFAGYLVDESIYTEYGGNRHSGPRTWADGVRSPGITMVTLMERPEKFTHEAWVKQWHSSISPVSEAIQPRTRYVRNEVLEALTPGAPKFEGIVSECWPSKNHVANSYLFYGAKNIFQLAVNMIRILKAVTSFVSLRRIQVNVMSEYIIKSGKQAESSVLNPVS